MCVCGGGGWRRVWVLCEHACVYVHAADRNLIPTRELSSRAQAGVPGARPESCCCAPVETMWGISLEQSPVKATLDQCCAGKCLTSSLGEKKKVLQCRSTCEFLWCNYSHHGRFQATSVMFLHVDLGRDAHGELS